MRGKQRDRQTQGGAGRSPCLGVLRGRVGQRRSRVEGQAAVRGGPYGWGTDLTSLCRQ